MSKKKFVVIDGNSLANRAFYALPPLTTSQGIITNAAYGFTTMLYKLLEDEKPDFMAVAFDKAKLTFRNKEYTEYKANRKGMPDDLKPQFPIIKDILQAMGIPIYELEGFEADDLIGTLSVKAEEKGWQVLIVTGDRDAFQLVTPNVKVSITRKGISELETYDESVLTEKYGLTPDQMIDLKGLMGDQSDNIPGIPGVGEKTALKLIHQFGTVEEVINRAGELSGKLKEKIIDNKDLAVLSKRLATIIKDVPIEINLDHCQLGQENKEEVLSLFKQLEFKGLLKKLVAEVDEGKEEVKSVITSAAVEIKPIADEKGWQELFTELKKADKFTFSYEDTGKTPSLAKLESFSISLESGLAYPVSLASFVDSETGQALRKEIFQGLQEVFNSSDFLIICQDAKRLMWLMAKEGIDFKLKYFDTMVGAYLLNPGSKNQLIEDIALDLLAQVISNEKNVENLALRSSLLWSLYEIIEEKLAALNMSELFYEVELPLAKGLFQMEAVGINVDTEQLIAMGKDLSQRIEQISEEIYTEAGEKFNINSPKQLGVILFEKLGLPPFKKTKTGYSTNAEVLDALAEQHAIVEKILVHRHLVKLKSTYVDGLINITNKNTGKVHTTFNQTITTTGRLSSTEPNIQNIPIRLEEGRKIRKVFVPLDEDSVILAADYSQIELRVLAHISEDETLMEAFTKNQDIHRRTASEVFGVSMEEVTSEMRSRAKAVNFGIVYGISDFGLAKDIKVSRKEAKEYIENYLQEYPKVRKYMEDIVVTAREQGYVSTILNRRRYLPDVLSSNYNVRNFGERTALNTPIQGSAADIIKVAMLRVGEMLSENNFSAKMLLQVHDELILNVPKEELAKVQKLVKSSMEQAVELKVPLVVDVKTGPNWYEVKPI